jgi:arylsulfatase A-like enzyme
MSTRPNILLITCDQYRFPRFSYGDDHGFHRHLKQILGFQEVDADNPYVKFFPGLMKLRKNAVVLRNHTIAASACTPSRAVIYTGQYGTRTGVTQTDGLFKNGDSNNSPGSTRTASRRSAPGCRARAIRLTISANGTSAIRRSIP